MNQSRFEDLWGRCCDTGTSPEPLFKELRTSYGEPHRRYHTGTHIDHCLAQLDLGREVIKEHSDAIELAIWFHDVEYHPGASDNEIKSADRFREIATGVMPPALIDQVYRLIIITIHSKLPEADDEKYIVDIDLSGFGLPWEEFFLDSQNVRKEFPDLSDQEFARKNGKFIEHLLARPSIYFTDFYRDRYEETARSNMEKQLFAFKNT